MGTKFAVKFIRKLKPKYGFAVAEVSDMNYLAASSDNRKKIQKHFNFICNKISKLNEDLCF